MQQDLGPEEYDFEPDIRPRHRLRGPLIAFLVMATSAGAVWIAYNRGHDRAPGEVPLIQADQGATKTRPQQPGGMAIPDQDKLVYAQGKAQGQVEKLLPPPETPLPRPSPPPEAAAPPLPPAPVAPPASGTAAAPTAAGATPQAATPQAVTPQAATPPQAAPAPAPVAAVAPPPPAPAAPVAAASGGGYRLQLGALRSEEAARLEWERIHRANGDVLGKLTAAWPRADLGERGVYYRIQTAPISDGAVAERLCGELKRRNVACILIHP
jgi:hypothetical protein